MGSILASPHLAPMEEAQVEAPGHHLVPMEEAQADPHGLTPMEEAQADPHGLTMVTAMILMTAQPPMAAMDHPPVEVVEEVVSTHTVTTRRLAATTEGPARSGST